MNVYRISRADYAKSLCSSGAANRWNRRGQNVIYTGASRSLSTLELVVHRGSVRPSIPYKVLVISLPEDEGFIQQIQIQDLPVNWRKMRAYSELQRIGSEWFDKMETLVLQVPSAVIPKECNFIINTEHPDFATHIKLLDTEDYFWDDRLA